MGTEQAGQPGAKGRVLAGTARPLAQGCTPGTALPGDERVEATLVLRRRAHPTARALSAAAAAPLTAQQAADEYGASPEDVSAVEQHLKDAGIDVVGADPATRRLRIAGPADAVNALLDITLERAEDPDGGSFRHHQQDITVPQPLSETVTAVLGLDTRPAARAHFRPAAAPRVSYQPPRLADVYSFPPDTDGSGQVIAIIELGGGYRDSDLDSYFSGLGVPRPTVSAVGVDGAENAPGGDTGADGEVALDIEVAGALAPGAEYLVYFAPNTDAGFLDAVAQAHSADPAPTAMSISWGQNEDQWTPQARQAMDDAFADAALRGVTVTAAAGDNGSSDGASDGAPHADFPASSPHVLGCGGTTLPSAADEAVWHGADGGATGGGVSTAFALPDFQDGVGVPPRAGSSEGDGRGVPDVAAVADPATGYEVLVNGQPAVYGGTSAVAPLWAALIARLAQATGSPFGLMNTALYQGVVAGAVATGFRDITAGDNGAYKAGPGWDACTGLGVPVGTDLLTALKGSAGAGSGGGGGEESSPSNDGGLDGSGGDAPKK